MRSSAKLCSICICHSIAHHTDGLHFERLAARGATLRRVVLVTEFAKVSLCRLSEAPIFWHHLILLKQGALLSPLFPCTVYLRTFSTVGVFRAG